MIIICIILIIYMVVNINIIMIEIQQENQYLNIAQQAQFSSNIIEHSFKMSSFFKHTKILKQTNKSYDIIL